ncbi:MAG: hypothetical protein U9Q68_01850, partial [Euryarchaeota archaeon]|nr:hypothetical protein [Euryarchaeota archaeon]
GIQPQRAQRDTEDRFNNSVLSVSSVVKSGGFYRLCGINSTTTDFAQFVKMFAQKYPDVEIIRQVMTTPTPTRTSYFTRLEVFEETERIMGKIEFHYIKTRK